MSLKSIVKKTGQMSLISLELILTSAIIAPLLTIPLITFTGYYSAKQSHKILAILGEDLEKPSIKKELLNALKEIYRPFQGIKINGLSSGDYGRMVSDKMRYDT